MDRQLRGTDVDPRLLSHAWAVNAPHDICLPPVDVCPQKCIYLFIIKIVHEVTDFQYSFAGRFCSKFAVNVY